MSLHGNLHIGHFYNKVLKDFVNRYQMLKEDQAVVYHLGFNCHGDLLLNEAVREHGQANPEFTFPADGRKDKQVREICQRHVSDKLEAYATQMRR